MRGKKRKVAIQEGGIQERKTEGRKRGGVQPSRGLAVEVSANKMTRKEEN